MRSAARRRVRARESGRPGRATRARGAGRGRARIVRSPPASGAMKSGGARGACSENTIAPASHASSPLRRRITSPSLAREALWLIAFGLARGHRRGLSARARAPAFARSGAGRGRLVALSSADERATDEDATCHRERRQKDAHRVTPSCAEGRAAWGAVRRARVALCDCAARDFGEAAGAGRRGGARARR